MSDGEHRSDVNALRQFRQLWIAMLPQIREQNTVRLRWQYVAPVDAEKLDLYMEKNLRRRWIAKGEMRGVTLSGLGLLSRNWLAGYAEVKSRQRELSLGSSDDWEHTTKRKECQHSPILSSSDSQQSRVPSEGYTHPVCATCGRRHSGECRRASGTCFKTWCQAGLISSCGMARKNTLGSSSVMPTRRGKMHPAVSLHLHRIRPPILQDSARITHVYGDLPLQFDDKIRSVNALPLDMCEFDMILGIDWLAVHRASVDCHSRRVIFGDIHAPEFIYQGSLPGKSMSSYRPLCSILHEHFSRFPHDTFDLSAALYLLSRIHTY
ncbi:putative reverse transcriptase domain-containing protein [Tanacetum coccineum]|uniref:Reverse transcriptase domain-containing protein n=1 Tax=Tanacetum coccineum TaxID=301880 RepID=A0ABQ5EVS1_9ASTR